MTLLSNAFEETDEREESATSTTTATTTTVSFLILNGDATYGGYGKPNTAIVRPVRRMEPADEPQPQASAQSGLQRSSYGANANEMSAVLVDTMAADDDDTMANKEMDNFARQLDMKLKGLQGPTKKSSSKNVIFLFSHDNHHV